MRPIRVVVFWGAVPDPGGVRLLAELREHPAVDVLAVLAESPGFEFRHRVRDLWRRRRWMAGPLLGAELVGAVARIGLAPLRWWRERRRLTELLAGVETVPNLHGASVIARVRALAPDLGLVYGGPILRPELFTIPRLGTLGIHHGKVPQYRGKKTTFWAMYNGEPTVGVTIQRLNAGVDTGEVVWEGEVPARGRRYRDVWADLEALGVELFLRSVLDMGSGLAYFRAQCGPKGRLYRDPRPGDLLRFWWRQRRRTVAAGR